MEMLREGVNKGYEVCMPWLLCGIYSYEYKDVNSLREVMDIYKEVCLLQDTYWYEFLYSRVLARKDYFLNVPTSNKDQSHYLELEE